MHWSLSVWSAVFSFHSSGEKETQNRFKRFKETCVLSLVPFTALLVLIVVEMWERVVWLWRRIWVLSDLSVFLGFTLVSSCFWGSRWSGFHAMLWARCFALILQWKVSHCSSEAGSVLNCLYVCVAQYFRQVYICILKIKDLVYRIHLHYLLPLVAAWICDVSPLDLRDCQLVPQDWEWILGQCPPYWPQEPPTHPSRFHLTLTLTLTFAISDRPHWETICWTIVFNTAAF